MKALDALPLIPTAVAVYAYATGSRRVALVAILISAVFFIANMRVSAASAPT